jgi:hypothetical protein
LLNKLFALHQVKGKILIYYFDFERFVALMAVLAAFSDRTFMVAFFVNAFLLAFVGAF